MRSRLLTLLVGLSLLPIAQAAAAERPVVIELFTSQGCSSCPPADALLTELSRGRDVLPLAFHVTYWNDLGWRDPFSLDAATERQAVYASRFGGGSFTPQLVVDGKKSVVGSNRGNVAAAIEQARAGAQVTAPVSLGRSGSGVTVDIGAGSGSGRILLVGFDRQRTTTVGRGENGGRTLTESNIVRSIKTLGQWSGAALRLNPSLGGGEDAAVIVQAPDGRILGAARLGGSSS